jgi:hypothetical protein
VNISIEGRVRGGRSDVGSITIAPWFNRDDFTFLLDGEQEGKGWRPRFAVRGSRFARKIDRTQSAAFP